MIKGIVKLIAESKGNVFGAIYGIINDAKNNNAKTLLKKKIILFRNDKFFTG